MAVIMAHARTKATSEISKGMELPGEFVRILELKAFSEPYEYGVAIETDRFAMFVYGEESWSKFLNDLRDQITDEILRIEQDMLIAQGLKDSAEIDQL